MQKKVYQKNKQKTIISEDWLSDIKLDGTESMAVELNLVFPLTCPKCHQEPIREKGQNYPIQVMSGGGFYCYACEIKGDAVNFASLVLFGVSQPTSPEQWKELKERLVSNVIPLRRPRASPAPPAPRPTRLPPPQAEVQEVWDLCGEVESDQQTTDQLVARQLDPQIITERQLARVLPRIAKLPSWCSGWTYRHRLIVPLYNSNGELVSLHARDIRKITEDPKGLCPTGFSSSGLVMADSLGVLLLRGETPSWFAGECNKVQIVEGVPHFLKYATRYTDMTSAPALFSINNGYWSQATADKVPNNTLVAINPHDDDTGKKYADLIRGTLKHCKTVTNLFKNN